MAGEGLSRITSQVDLDLAGLNAFSSRAVKRGMLSFKTTVLPSQQRLCTTVGRAGVSEGWK